MWKMIYKRLFSRKWELIILGAILIVLSLSGKFIAVAHWESVDFNLDSYSPYAPFLVIGYAIVGSLVLWIRKIRAPSLWVIFISSFIYGGIMLWAIWMN